MQKANEKPKWRGPKLIMLVRGRQDESVLDGCKSYHGGGGWGGDVGGDCLGSYNPMCPDCAGIGGS